MILIIQLVRSDEGELKPYPLKACRGFSHDFFRCASLSPQIDCRCHDARDSCNRQPECVLRWRRWNRWQISNGKFLARLLAVLICGGWWQIILQPATLHTKITDEISNGFSGETSSQHKNTMCEREKRRRITKQIFRVVVVVDADDKSLCLSWKHGWQIWL